MIDVTSTQKEIIVTILQQYIPDVPVYAYGSRVKGTARKFSDLDLCIMNQSPLSHEDLGGLRDAFSESDLPYKVDITEWARANDETRNRIKEHAIELTSHDKL